jgi:hypothetical protein
VLSPICCDDSQGEPAETSWQTQAGTPPSVSPVLPLDGGHPDKGEAAPSLQPFVGTPYLLETNFSKMKVRASSKGESGATTLGTRRARNVFRRPPHMDMDPTSNTHVAVSCRYAYMPVAAERLGTDWMGRWGGAKTAVPDTCR